MAVTRAQAEAVLVGAAPTAGAGLVGGLLVRIGYDATGDSPVAALSDAITEGLIECGVTPDDVTAPGDDDLALLPTTLWQKFRDIAEVRLLEIATVGGVGGSVKQITFEDYSKELSDVKEILDTKRTHCRNRWGYGAASLKAGSFRVGGAACSEF